MNKRQKEVQQVFLDSEKAVLKQLEANYKEALKEIDSKLEVLMARQDADMSHVIYQIEHQRALKTQVKSILENLQSKEFDSISEYLANAYTNGFVGTMYDIHGQGIPLIVPIDQKKVLEAIKHETKLSENLYTALGHDITELQKTIAGEISRGISSGQGYAEIARNIASQANIPKNRAMTIARTESHRIQCKATSDAQFEAKAKGADVLKQWDSTLDGYTREHHRMIDGQIRELEEHFSVGKFKPRFPGDFGDPAEDCNCRCALLQRARWALGKEELNTLKERAEFFGLDKSGEFADFKKKYLQATDRVRVSAPKIKAVREAVERIEAEERSLKYECGAIVDKSGNVLKRYKGTEHAVEVSDDDLDLMKDCIFTHNHPLGVFFSDNDIQTGFVKTKLAELRASTPQGITYVLKSDGNTTESANAFIQGYKQARMRANRNAQTAIINRVKMGEITLDDYKQNFYTYYRQYEDEMLVKYAENNAKEFGFIFEVEKNE